jgi:phosphohistidine phosphatase
MKVYLVRHAEAVNQQAMRDRPLSDTGRRDAEAMAQLFKRLQVSAPVIWHSGKARSKEMAEIINAVIPASQGLLLHDGLLPMDPVKRIAKLLSKYESDLMIVGHDPFLSELAAKLITGKRRKKVLDLAKGEAVCLERDDSGDWSILWAVTPEIAHAAQTDSGIACAPG